MHNNNNNNTVYTVTEKLFNFEVVNNKIVGYIKNAGMGNYNKFLSLNSNGILLEGGLDSVNYSEDGYFTFLLKDGKSLVVNKKDIRNVYFTYDTEQMVEKVQVHFLYFDLYLLKEVK